MHFLHVFAQTCRVGECRITLVTQEWLDPQVDVPVVLQTLSIAELFATEFALIPEAFVLYFHMSSIAIWIKVPILTCIALQTIVLLQAMFE